MGEVLEIENDGHLRVLRLNRPERKNALNGALLQGLTESLRAASQPVPGYAIVSFNRGKQDRCDDLFL